MLVKLQILLTFFSQFVFCQSLQSISPLSLYNSEVINKRILELNDSNCEIKNNGYCQKCKDKFMQPYCSTCPIGYKLENNKCIKCGDYQLFCGSPNPDDYCYKGFVKVGDQCVCQGKSIVQNYCLSSNEIAYIENFIGNKILVQFSSEIQLTTPETDKSLICDAVLKNYNQYKNKIKCYLNLDNARQFYIEIQKTYYYEDEIIYGIIPEIKNDYISFKNNKEKPSLIYQPSYLKSEKEPRNYFGNNDYTSLLSYFKKSVYYIDIDTPTEMQKEEFVDLFSISYPNYSDTIHDNIKYAFANNQYPKNTVSQLPFYKQNNLNVLLIFKNKYPYNVTLSNTVTFITADFKTSFSEFTLKNTAPYFNDEAIPIIIKFKLPGVIFLEDDEVKLEISFYKFSKRQTDLDLTEYVKFKNFPYTFNIPPYTMEFDSKTNNIFQIGVQPFLYKSSLNSSSLQEISIQGKPIYVQIVGGNRENVDPRETIQLNGQARNPTIKDSKSDDFTYIWNCYDEVLKTSCKNEFLKDLTLEKESIISLNANTFDFQGIYTLTVDATEKKSQNSAQSKITIKTISGKLQVDYDKSYNTGTILPDELLKFKLEYTGNDKLKNSYLDHSFEIGYEYQQTLKLTPQATPQKENFIFTRLIDSVSEEYLKGSLNFFMRFFVLDQNLKIVDATRRINFKTRLPPYDCKLVFDGIKGNEVSFVDKIKLKASNCKSSINDGKLLYQFLYYNQDKFQNNEKQFPDVLYRKYLSKFQEEDSIETYLPPGQIVFVVLVKDSKETKMKFSNSITIKQNSFDQTQYEDFLKNENSEATAFYKSTQYEKQVCIYGLMIECIENFENQNKNLDLTQKVSDLKIFLKNQFLYLPSLIPNDLMSQSLQEFTVRCLKRLYNTVNGPDKQNQINRIKEVSDFVKQRIDLMKTLKPFIPEVRDTYKKKMLITLDITAQTIEQLSSSTMSTPSTSWSDLQIKEVTQNLESLGLTLYVNQQSIAWNTKVVNVQVQKVDQFNLFKNYLDYDMAKFGDSNLESDQIYNVEIQQWKDNIYSFEQGFKDMFEASISKTNDPQIISYLKQTYPAIYPRVTKSYQVNRRLRQLEEEEFLTLPANINSEFKGITGNKKVKCAQRMKDVWTKSSCKTSIIQTGNSFTVSCSCATPSFTSIVADVEALFQNSNMNKIFSEAGLNTLLSLDNWYQYSAVYVLIVLNVAVLVSFAIGIKLDKADAGVQGLQQQTIIANNLMIDRQQNEIKYQKNNSEQNNLHTIELNNKQITKKSSTQEGSPGLDFKSNSLIHIKEIESQLTRNPTKATSTEIKKDQIQNESQAVIEKKFNYEVPQKWQQNEQPSQKLNCEKNQENPSQSEESQNNTDNVCTMHRVNFVECQGHEQHQIPIYEDTRKFSAYDVDADIALKGQEKSELSKKEIKKLRKQQKESQKKEQDANIQKKSLEYLMGLSVFRGTCVFHDLLQIFIVYDSKKTRLYRFSIFYNQLIWLLTLSATFGESLTIVQVITLSVVSSFIFGLFKVILKFILNKKSIRIIGYILIFSFLLFCYYAIAVVIGTQLPSQVNGWIMNYILAQCIDIFISGVISSAVKYYSTLKFLPKYQISHIVYKFTSADTLFGVFK